MHRLLASVVLSEAGNVRLEIMGVHGPQSCALTAPTWSCSVPLMMPPVRPAAPPLFRLPALLILSSSGADGHWQIPAGA
jgi:hypothetical protein